MARQTASALSLRVPSPSRGSERSVEELVDHHNDGLAWIRDVLPLYPDGFYKPGAPFGSTDPRDTGPIEGPKTPLGRVRARMLSAVGKYVKLTDEG